MKTCPVCKIEKPDHEFHRRHGKLTRCKLCRKIIHKQHYNSNKKFYEEQAKNRKEEIVKRINEFKNVPCADCGRMFDTICMDFDHLPDTHKVMEVTNMISRGCGLGKILEEIKKCEIVCACCHRLRHKARRCGVNVSMLGFQPGGVG